MRRRVDTSFEGERYRAMVVLGDVMRGVFKVELDEFLVGDGEGGRGKLCRHLRALHYHIASGVFGCSSSDLEMFWQIKGSAMAMAKKRLRVRLVGEGEDALMLRERIIPAIVKGTHRRMGL